MKFTTFCCNWNRCGISMLCCFIVLLSSHQSLATEPSKQDKDWEKLNEIIAKEAKKNGNNIVVQRSGNFTFVGPKYYEKDKTPISSIEKKIYDEYIQEIGDPKSDHGNYEIKKNQMAGKLIKRYHMTPEDFIYLLGKIEYNEVTPESYRPPKE